MPQTKETGIFVQYTYLLCANYVLINCARDPWGYRVIGTITQKNHSSKTTLYCGVINIGDLKKLRKVYKEKK